MLTIEECRHILDDPLATDDEITRLKDELYRFVNRFLDGHFAEDPREQKPYNTDQYDQ